MMTKYGTQNQFNRGLDVLMSQGGDELEVDRGGSLDDLALDALSAAGGEPTGQAADDAEPTETVVARCDRLGLDVPGRLRVFQTVCLAVHQAHQKGVIFGDLSPSRLTIAADGAVVAPTARGLDGEIGEWSSPERVRGEPPTIAGDIHALGVLLYELLTDKPPYRVDYEDPDALAEAIVDQVPERPSRAAPRDRGRIGGDLDLIVGKALFKEPERRYASAVELADDLDQYLARLPVRARRSTELYRLTMFLKRRKWVTPAIALLVLGAVAGVVEGGHRFQSVRLDRDRAERDRLAARGALAASLDRLADEPNVGDDPRVLRRDLLADLGRYYDEFLETDTEAADLAELADARTQSAVIARALGDRADAAARFQNAVDLWKAVVAERSGDFAAALRLAEAQADLGRTLDPGDEDDEPEADEALRALASARELLTSLADERPESADTRRELARTLGDLARLQRRRGSDEALGSIRGAVKLWEELVWEAPADLDARLALASALGRQARIEEGRPDGPPAALKTLQRADEVLSAAPNADKAPPRLTFEQAKRLNDLASLERNLGAARAALGHANHASELIEPLARKYPTEPDYRAELALTYNLSAELHRAVGKRVEALDLARKARELLERLMVEEPDEPAHPIDLATTWQLIGRLHGQSRENVEALRAFRRAIDLLEGRKELDGPSHYALACNLSLGLSLVGAKDGDRPPDDDDPVLSPTDKLRRRVYADRAVAVLGEAIAQGFGNLELYRTDPALDPIRSHDDFKKLLDDLAAKADGGP